ncbi:MAG TPA: hypothetical protein VFD74_04120, partial [Thermoleophilia bacterium]|nr:hypothetical protein [Thermoleophilia bacterium]
MLDGVASSVECAYKPVRWALRLRYLVRPAALVVGSALVYKRWLRHWSFSWGASPEEEFESMPGDDFVTDPQWITTRAVSIDAPPSRVWPWLVQMGQGRGGLYSYDRLENLVGSRVSS